MIKHVDRYWALHRHPNPYHKKYYKMDEYILQYAGNSWKNTPVPSDGIALHTFWCHGFTISASSKAFFQTRIYFCFSNKKIKLKLKSSFLSHDYLSIPHEDPRSQPRPQATTHFRPSHLFFSVFSAALPVGWSCSDPSNLSGWWRGPKNTSAKWGVNYLKKNKWSHLRQIELFSQNRVIECFTMVLNHL